MKINWLTTTAVALVLGSGAVIAQTQSDQTREEGPRAQQTKDTDREKGADRQMNRTAQPEQKGSKQQRGEANSPAERKQAQEPQHDTKQPTKQSQDQQKRGEPSSAPTQQSQDQQKGRDTKQAAEPKQKQDNQAQDTKRPEQKNQARDTKQPEQRNQARGSKQPEQKNEARDAKQPTDTKQQQGQQTPSTPPSSNQTARPSTSPSTTPTQQSAQPNNTTDQNRQGQTAGQNDRNRSSTSTSVTANDWQRTQVINRLRNDRGARNPNINIQVTIGERLPARVHARRLPLDIVRIEPRYRGYEYTVVEDQIYIVEPRTKKVVDIIREPSPSVQTQTTYRNERVVLSTEQRETLKQSAHRLSSAPVAATPSGSSPDSSCLTLQPVPEEIARNNPELGQYKMLAIGDQVVLVDPRQQKVVEVIE